MSSISIIPTLDMVAQQGAELNRNITLNGGHNITLNNVANTVAQMLAGIDDGLLIDSNLLNTDLIIRNTNDFDTILRNLNGSLRLLSKDVDASLRAETCSSFGIPTRASAPTAYNGGIYYDTTLNKFRVYENGGWVNMV